MIAMATSFLASNTSALIINEIMYDPVDNENYNEWLEIYNDEDGEVDLSDFSICDVSLLSGYVDREGNTNNDEGMILQPGKYAMITDGGSGTEVYDNYNVHEDSLALHVDAGSICGRLNNVGDTIVIKNSNDEEIDSVTYSAGVEEGYSLELISGDFVESEDEGGTPGDENSYGSDDNDGDDSDGDDSNNDDDSDLINNSENNQEIDTISTVQTNQREKIVLNAPIQSEEVNEVENEDNTGDIFVSKQERLRMWVIYSFLIFAVLLIILLALRRL